MNATQPRLFTPPPATTIPSDEWYTPIDIIDAARSVFGCIDCDPASSRAAQTRVNATTFYTLADDGLSQLWHGDVWLNGPYSDLLPWMNKLKHEYRYSKRVTGYIALVPERLGVKWFNIVRDLSSAMCMFDERIRFVRADGRGTTSPNFGNVAFYAGVHPLVFKRVFSRFGAVWVNV